MITVTLKVAIVNLPPWIPLYLTNTGWSFIFTTLSFWEKVIEMGVSVFSKLIVWFSVPQPFWVSGLAWEGRGGRGGGFVHGADTHAPLHLCEWWMRAFAWVGLQVPVPAARTSGTASVCVHTNLPFMPRAPTCHSCPVANRPQLVSQYPLELPVKVGNWRHYFSVVLLSADKSRGWLVIV